MNKLTTTIELFSVHQSFRVRFTMVIKNDDLVSQKYQFKNKGVINKYAYDGNVSLKINPFPFIIIDISTKQDKKEGWNANWSFALNRRELFIMIVKLTNLYKKFKTIENLFYINSYGETEVNKEISEYNKEVFIASYVLKCHFIVVSLHPPMMTGTAPRGGRGLAVGCKVF